MYKKEKKIYVLILFLLAYVLCINGQIDSFIKASTGDQLPKVDFGFKPVDQATVRPLKLILKDSDQMPKIPFPIITEPLIWFGSHFIEKGSSDYSFELFKFYEEINVKLNDY